MVSKVDKAEGMQSRVKNLISGGDRGLEVGAPGFRLETRPQPRPRPGIVGLQRAQAAGLGPGPYRYVHDI